MELISFALCLHSTTNKLISQYLKTRETKLDKFKKEYRRGGTYKNKINVAFVCEKNALLVYDRDCSETSILTVAKNCHEIEVSLNISNWTSKKPRIRTSKTSLVSQYACYAGCRLLWTSGLFC
jgi:hypothetical protein